MTERTLAEALRTVADEVPVPPLPTDLWRRGRRRHRRRIAAALTATATLAVVVAVPLTWLGPAPERVEPAEPPGAAPSVVYPPMPWQRTVQQAPAGRAALIVSGEGAFRGSDLFGYEGRTVVVSRAGRYRLVNGAHEGEVGDEFQLSPDGRYLAAPGPVDGTDGLGWDATSLVDLTTGRVRGYPGGIPVAWAPDGRHLLIQGFQHGPLAMLDIGSGAVRRLDATGIPEVRGRFTAFAPDGGRVVVGVGGSLYVADVATGTTRKLVDLGRRYRLAGPGAWTADGRIAVWEAVAGCEDDCELPYPGTGEFRLRFLDAGSGADVAGTGLDQVRGQFPRLLGWQRDGDAVVETYRPAPPQASAPAAASLEVVALRPGGGRAVLVRLPADAHHVDVARDLLAEGRFGGAPPSTGDRLSDWLGGLAGRLAVLAAIVAGVVGVVVLRRRIRDRRGS
ncbi:hypothetical protein ACNTMW_22695 [Planosporangium sp. 12N6]|uniref:hypothetical protein n=1 Tax=Planosporangium spinosum TaxID=3402278 RepID=UPI003CF26D82